MDRGRYCKATTVYSTTKSYQKQIQRHEMYWENEVRFFDTKRKINPCNVTKIKSTDNMKTLECRRLLLSGYIKFTGPSRDLEINLTARS